MNKTAKDKVMTESLRKEIEDIERRKKAEFEAAGHKLFGVGFAAKQLQPYDD